MKRQITLGEALGFVVTILVVVISAWITQTNESSRQDERVKMLEKSKDEVRTEIKELKDNQRDNYKSLTEKLENIRILIENKQDRKK
jgi:CHASE3 domain sensor protein